jgi:hypothetical protein
MDHQLRPLSLGEILDRTAELYRTHFSLFAGLSAIFAGAMLAWQMLHLGLISLMGYPHIPPHLQWAYAVSLGIDLLVISLLAGLSIAAFNRAVAWIYLGKTATVRSSAASVFSHLGRYLWLITVTMFRAWGPLFGLYVLLFVMAFAALPHGFLLDPEAARQPANINPGAAIGALLGIAVLGILFFPALIYGVWMWLRYSLAVPACVVENLPAGQAIRRGIDLSLGSRGRLFVLWLLVFAVRMVLGILIGFPLVLFSFRHLGHPLPLSWMAYSQLSGFVENTLIGPVYSIGLTLFYYDQRIRKEGFDIEWMMQAAGLESQQASSELAAGPFS